MNIMIVCPTFRGIENGIIESFKRLGCNVFPFFFSMGFRDNDIASRIRNKIGLSIERALERNREEFNKEIMAYYEECHPDFVYVIQGRWMDIKTLQHMKEKSYLALYLWDMISLFPEMKKTFSCYHQIYSFDKSDVVELLQEGYCAKFKPSGYDNTVYFPLGLQKKENDIVYIGAMYPERVTILKELIGEFPDLRWAIYGEYAPIRKPMRWIKWRLSSEYKYFKNMNISKECVNEEYNKAKIVLSIVRNNQKDGWSARLPEILGAGAFQITNHFESVAEEFEDCVVLYKSLDALKQLIRYYINNDYERNEIASKGYQKVVDLYSDDRLNEIVLNDYWSHMKGD